mmetsp:Transcript_32609/g.63632  ORF Transcript_32609/g.63632 Transcript_32609/m.63632 type:complete len:108 (-) Transcript_32609:94-417(-)
MRKREEKPGKSVGEKNEQTVQNQQDQGAQVLILSADGLQGKGARQGAGRPFKALTVMLGRVEGALMIDQFVETSAWADASGPTVAICTKKGGICPPRIKVPNHARIL